MSKKGFGKFLIGAAVIGTAAALIAYVKQTQSKEDLTDDFDDFDDDLNEEIFDHDSSSKETDDRHYVTIPLDKSAEETPEASTDEAIPPVSEKQDADAAASDEENEVHAFNLEDET
ncbi:MAG TPA: hypothetical protein IAB48_09965 [Candidatus Fimimorpha excrementavium]|nr:hypothetical protein [Candidatus Fimimorpha excrementavium]